MDFRNLKMSGTRFPDLKIISDGKRGSGLLYSISNMGGLFLSKVYCKKNATTNE
jgi:hypothetical protein